MKKLQPHFVAKLATMLRRLDSLKESDRLLALRGANRLLRDHNLTWEQVLTLPVAAAESPAVDRHRVERELQERDSEIQRLVRLVEEQQAELDDLRNSQSRPTRGRRRQSTSRRISVWMDREGYIHVKLPDESQPRRLRYRMDDAGNKAAIKDMLNEMREFCREHKLSQGQLATMQKRLRQHGFRYKTQKRSALVVF